MRDSCVRDGGAHRRRDARNRDAIDV